VYDIAQAVEDGATVRIYYESRLAKVNLSEEGKQLVEKLDDELAQDDLTETQKAKAKWTQLEALIGSENRIKNIAISHNHQFKWVIGMFHPVCQSLSLCFGGMVLGNFRAIG
jgi:type I site-specific restriction-modification system R (restriction) subunit